METTYDTRLEHLPQAAMTGGSVDNLQRKQAIFYGDIGCSDAATFVRASKKTLPVSYPCARREYACQAKHKALAKPQNCIKHLQDLIAACEASVEAVDKLRILAGQAGSPLTRVLFPGRQQCAGRMGGRWECKRREGVVRVEKRVVRVEKRVIEVRKRVVRVEKRVIEVRKRIVRVEKRVIEVRKRVVKLKIMVVEMEEKRVVEARKRVIRVEKRVFEATRTIIEMEEKRVVRAEKRVIELTRMVVEMEEKRAVRVEKRVVELKIIIVEMEKKSQHFATKAPCPSWAASKTCWPTNSSPLAVCAAPGC
ncbi:hypothetical protein CDD81_170 [Ophiocordyceps australis]|uniref:Uncharacterized protein n=1 Tax=Ophiocordyceps australis TaxID=1399860 RepID=A0A2C5YBM0_9HYPO|nr:hypothetical protein CDD81_170 [Ophiocordyceps australis]